jgi:hypothetical protein
MNRLVPMLSAICLLGLGCSKVKQMIVDRLEVGRDAGIALVDSQLTKAQKLLLSKTTKPQQWHVISSPTYIL